MELALGPGKQVKKLGNFLNEVKSVEIYFDSERHSDCRTYLSPAPTLLSLFLALQLTAEVVFHWQQNLHPEGERPR
jgi:hypothetical protein